jgi:hypothetical protein
MTTDTYDLGNPLKPTILKDKDATLDYTWDFTDWLNDVSDSINTFTVTPDSPVTVQASQIDGTGKKVIAFLSGGTVKKTHAVVCHIQTVSGRQDDRSIYLKIRER